MHTVDCFLSAWQSFLGGYHAAAGDAYPKYDMLLTQCIYVVAGFRIQIMCHEMCGTIR